MRRGRAKEWKLVEGRALALAYRCGRTGATPFGYTPTCMPRASTGKPSKQAASLELVLSGLEAVLQHGVQMTCDYIDRGNETFITLSAEKAALKKGERNLNATMLNKLPVTCKHLHGVALGDSRFASVIFYERTRLGAASSGHFMEGLPAGLNMFTGQTKVALQDSDLIKLKLKDVVADRVRTVTNLESLRNNEPRLLSLIEDYKLTDVASGTPGRVHVFLARMRAICQGLRRVKPAEYTKHCHNRECCRLFYSGARNEVSAVEATAEDLFGECKSKDDSDYWILCAGGQQQLDQQSNFCTHACFKQWNTQVHHALPDSSEGFMVADYQTRKTGRARVGEALRLICKRNEQASRHMRVIQKERRVFPAVDPQELKEHRERRVRALNVDLGLVYVASVLAESKSLSGSKVLAGMNQGWRNRAMFYSKSIKEVGKIYDKYHVGGNVISNMHVTEPFLDKLKTKAARLV